MDINADMNMEKDEKIIYIKYLLRVKQFTTWSGVHLRDIRFLLRDSELSFYRRPLLILTYKIVTNRSLLQYIQARAGDDSSLAITHDLINMYMMSLEDINACNA